MCKPLSVISKIQILAVHGPPDGGDPAEGDVTVFCYSVGMQQFEKPDLLVRDVPPFLTRQAVRFLNEWCQYLADGATVRTGELMGDGTTYRVRITPAPENFRQNPFGLMELVAADAPACGHCGGGHGDHPGEF
jgi:hypothetical protein